MAPDWKKLMDEFAGDPAKLVADVDCTAAGKPLCETHGVKGYPTLKYGDPSDLEDYKGGRSLADLKKHVEEKLVASCSPANIDLCDDAKKAEIETFKAMPSADLDALIAAKSTELEDAEADFKKSVEGLQKSYEGFQKAKESKLEEIKNSGLGLMKAVSKHVAKVAKEEVKDEL
jgi:hypothetical protein